VDLGNGERNMSRNLSKLSRFCLTKSRKDCKIGNSKESKVKQNEDWKAKFTLTSQQLQKLVDAKLVRIQQYRIPAEQVVKLFCEV